MNANTKSTFTSFKFTSTLFNKQCINLTVGDITCLATIPPKIQAEAQFLAKDTGIIAGIAMASLIFQEVDPSLTVCITFRLFMLQ